MTDVTLVQIRFRDDECDALDRYRRRQKNPPSRPQAIRDLLKDVFSAQSGASTSEAEAAL
jgi:hypothetical protein